MAEADFTLFQGPVETGLAIYRGSQDDDQKALVLNTQIVQSQEGVATPGSIRLVRMLFVDEQSLVQYRPSVITGLNHENLMAIANGLVSDQAAADPLSQAEEQIRRVAADEGSQSPLVSAPKEFEEDVLAELAERLDYQGMMPQERAEFIGAIDSMVTEELLRKIVRSQPTVFAAFLRNVEEFSNDDLRAAIIRLSWRLRR